MNIHFVKYQGTGNDFIMLDNRNHLYDEMTIQQIQYLCHRKFGIGADGLIKINSADGFDFEVDYYNADGSKSFCGNGARCSVMFAKSIHAFQGNSTRFLAIDGEHSAEIIQDEVSLLMQDVAEVRNLEANTYETNTGSPHYIKFVEDLSNENIVEFGKSIRYNDTYQANGINVNLVESVSDNVVKVQTYERGVEDETLSCGTGVTAVALSLAVKENQEGENLVHIETKGGKLSVSFDRKEGMFTNIHLIGPAMSVFQGEITI